jgi:GT2 family glycosyltransferase
VAAIRFLCVNFNNTIFSRKLVKSLEIQNGRLVDFSAECIIVDNSTDEQAAEDCRALSIGNSWVKYFRAPTNLGYFGGLNYGLSMMEAAEAAYVVICNNDLEFEEDFCERLIRTTYAPNIFSVCPDVISADGRHQNPHVLRRINWLRRLQFDLFFAHYYVSRLLLLFLRVVRPVKASPPQAPERCEIHLGVGACYVLTREFFKRFKKLEYPHFLCGEESYFSDQIHSVGGVLLLDPDLRVHHAESAAISKMPTRAAYEFARGGYHGYREIEKRWNREGYLESNQ